MATDSKSPTFIHLRAHSAYSLAEGALHIKQMAVLAKEAGMPALAITDSGNLFGALEFSEAWDKLFNDHRLFAGLKPMRPLPMRRRKPSRIPEGPLVFWPG
jgi:DNA polymerase III alpha subunit (gram-positive type)